MAVSKDDVLVKIVVNTKDAQSSLSNLTVETSKFTKESVKATNQVRESESSFIDSSEVINDYSENIVNNNVQINNYTNVTKRATKANENYQSSLSKTGDVLRYSVSGISAAVSAYKLLTDPVMIGRLNKLAEATERLSRDSGFKRTAAAMELTRGGFNNLTGEMQSFNKTLEKTLGLNEEVSLSFSSLVTSIDKISATLSALVNIFNTFTDPQNIEKVASLADIAAAAAGLKGFGVLSESLSSTADKLHNLASESVLFGDAAATSFEDVATKARTYNKVMGSLSIIEPAATVAALGVISHKLLSLNVDYRFFADDTKRSMSSLFRYMKGDVSAFFSSLISSLQQMNRSMITLPNLAKAFKTMFHFSDMAPYISAPFFLLGSYLQSSENKLISFSGTVLKTVSIIASGISAVFVASMAIVGSIFTSIGGAILNRMTAFEEKAIKLEKTMALFTFTVKGFGAALGEEAVGSVSMWEDQMQKMTETTAFSRDEIGKSIKLLVAEGKIIGLTAEDNIKLLERSADVAASTGNNLDDVTQSMVNALTYNAQAVLSYGIDIRDLTLSHDEYLKSTGLTIEQLNAEQLARLRLNALYERTTPIVGAATAATLTIAGATKQYEAAVDSVQAKIGSYGILSRKLMVLQIKIAQWWAETPDFILGFVGVLGDVLGVTLTIIGTFLKWSAISYTLFNVIKLLISAINSFFGLAVSLQWLLTSVLAPIIAATSALLLLGVAIHELAEESTAFADTFSSIADAFSSTNQKAEETSKSIFSLSAIFKAVIGAIKYIIIGFVQAINAGSLAIVEFRALFAESEEDEEAYSLMIEEISMRMSGLTMASNEASKSFDVFGNSTAYASEAMGASNQAAKKLNLSLEDFKTRVKKGAKEINSAYDSNAERLRVLGNEYEKTVASASSAQSDLQKIFKQKLSEKETIQKYADAERAANQSVLEIEKLRLDTLKKIKEQAGALQLEVYRSRGENIRAIREETALQIEQVNKQLEGLKLLGDLKKEDEAEIKKTISLINQISYTKVNEELDKHNEKIENLKTTTQKLIDASRDGSKTEILAIKERTAERLKELDSLEKSLKKTNDLSKKAKELLAVARQAASGAEKKDVNDLLLKTLEDIEKQNQQIAIQNETFGMNTTDRLNKELEIQLDLIEAQRQKLILEGKYSEAIEASLAKQNDLLKKRTEQRIGSESSPAEKAVKSLGDMGSAFKNMFGSAFSDSISSLSGVLGDAFTGIGSNISGYISSALGDSLGGVMSGIGDVVGQFASSTMSMISSVATLIMQLPAIIGSANDMLKGLLKFPAELLSSLGELFTTILQVLTVSFVKTLGELPGKLLKMLTDFVPKLANALIALIAELPDIMIKFLDSFPKMVGGLVSALAENAPRIIKSLIDALIKKGPALFASLARYAPKIAFAIAKALWDALYGLITGGLPDIEISVDTAALSDTFKKMGEALGESTSRLFNVSELTDSKDSSPNEALKSAAQAVSDSFSKGASWLSKVWENWMSVIVSFWRNIMEAFGNLWEGAKAIFQGFIDGIYGIWLTIKQLILDPLINGLKSAWEWVMNNIVDPLVKGLGSVAETLKGVIEPIIGVGKKIVDGLTEALDGVMSQIFDGFYSIGKNMVKGLVDSLMQIGGAIGKLIGALPSVNVAAPKFGKYDGGIIPGNAVAFGDSPRNDVVPAMLSPGEAVIPRSLMQDPDIAEVIRGILSKRGVPSFSEGLMPRLTGGGGGTTEINLGGLVVNTTQSVDADFVRSRLMPTIRNELRRASLDGQTVIYKTGIR